MIGMRKNEEACELTSEHGTMCEDLYVICQWPTKSTRIMKPADVSQALLTALQPAQWFLDGVTMITMVAIHGLNSTSTTYQG